MTGRRFHIKMFSACLLFVFSGTMISTGQEPFFTIISAGREVNNASIQTICQDQKGFIWLGTSKGLYRYDGIQFNQVLAGDSTQDASYTALFANKDQTLWAGTSTGRIARVTRGKFFNFMPMDGGSEAPITAISEDHRGNIWVSTYGDGVYCRSGNRLYNFKTNDGLGDNFTYTMACDSAGRIWIGTDGGISVCSILNGKKKIVPINSTNGLPDNIVLSLTSGDDGVMWAGMQDGGICKIDVKSMRVKVPDALQQSTTGPVNSMVISGSRLWAASGSKGILSVDLHLQGIYHEYGLINGSGIFKVARVINDIQGNLWFLSGNSLIRTQGEKLEILSSLINPAFSNIKSIFSARNGSLWFSNDRGLFRLQNGAAGGGKPEEFISMGKYPGVHIVSIYEDRDEYIWAGTFGNGVFRLNPKTGTLNRYSERNGLANDNVMSISGFGNEVWFATLGGASRCLLKGSGSESSTPLFEQFGKTSGLGNNFIYHVFVDAGKRVWFGTDGKGLSVNESGRFVNFSAEKEVKDKIVYSITQEQNGHIWFSTSNAGLYHYDGKSFRNFNLANGLSDLSITGLAAASSPLIFIVHPGGIDILEPVAEKFRYLGQEDGIGQLSSNLNAVTADLVNDLVWIGTDQGIIKLSAREFRNPVQPRIYLDKVKVFLTETDTTEPHIFAHNKNHFTFDYIGLWFKAPDRIHYRAMLKGYDIGWITTRNTSVIYSSLAPGDYTFMVSASLNDDFSDAPVAYYNFTIRKPFWMTYWFIALTLCLSGAAVYLFVITRERRLRREESLQQEKILYQFETLKSQVNPHFLFNSFSTLSAVIDEDKDMALDYVQKLSAFFRNVLEYREKTVITLGEELALADTYYYLQKKRYGSSFQMITEIPDFLLSTFIPPMTLQMIIENAVKHNVVSADKPLIVKIYSTNNMIIVTNPIQVKKSVPFSTGIGLQNIRNRYRLLISREIEISISGGNYLVMLPVINSLPS